jgi:hypothetical protein
LKEAVLPPSTECSFLGNDENVDAASGEAFNHVMQRIIQGDFTPIATSPVVNDPSAQPAPGPPVGKGKREGGGRGKREGRQGDFNKLDSNAPIVVASLLTNPDSAPLGFEGVAFKEAILPPSTECYFLGNDENVEASGGKGAGLLLQTVQDASTTMATSGTQAQAPPPIVVINVAGKVTKGEQERKPRLDIATVIN